MSKKFVIIGIVAVRIGIIVNVENLNSRTLVLVLDPLSIFVDVINKCDVV